MGSRTPGRAFTLIELIIALVILGVAMPSMLWAIRDSHFRRVDSFKVEQARWLAEEKLEDIIADRHSTTRGYSYVAGSNYSAESPVSGFTGFSRSVTVTESGVNLVSGSGTGFKTATVTVSYADGFGATRSFSVSTVLTSY